MGSRDSWGFRRMCPIKNGAGQVESSLSTRGTNSRAGPTDTCSSSLCHTKAPPSALGTGIFSETDLRQGEWKGWSSVEEPMCTYICTHRNVLLLSSAKQG